MALLNDTVVLPDGLILCDEVDRDLLARADRFHANPQAPALIEGETGTGKELWARRLHHGGRPNREPFVAINCAAISPGLFEAELFGYEEGAFSGAAAGGRPGKMSLAGDGTLFLDEVAEMPLEQQAKLLRALESRTYFRVGGRELQHFTARVICACNSDLYKQVKRGSFRQDLYYRLKVAQLRLRPLRQRRDSIPVLARSFTLRNYTDGLASFDTIAEDGLEYLKHGEWPGNVRQLVHLIEEAGLLTTLPVLDKQTLVDLMKTSATTELVQRVGSARRTSALVPKAQRVPIVVDWANLKAEHMPEDAFPFREWEGAVLKAALEKHRGSPVRAAKYLGLSRKVLYTMRKNHGLLEKDRLAADDNED